MDWFILLLAGFIGGFFNALAGGGSFVALPAMILVGLPPVTANASATAALLPGYLSSAWRFRKDIQLPNNVSLPMLLVLSLCGGSIGALILLNTDNTVFAFLIPWLILLATAFFVIGPWLMQSASKQSTYIGAFVLFIVCIYGGFFNGGLGIILLAVLKLISASNLQGLNGIKNVISAVLTLVAVCIYALGEKIALPEVIITGIAAIAGGYAGAAFSYAISDKTLKMIIVALGLTMAAVFFVT